jgi:hypothetical protein
MSEFQTGLLLIGALAVAAVFGYNKWQEHRAGRAADESFKSRHPDVLVENAAVPVPRSAGRAAGDDSRIEPVVVSRSPVQAGSPGAAAVAIPDARVDYVIELTGPTQVNAALLAELWAAVEQRFPRRARLAGFVDGQRVPLPPGATGQQLEAALQLVSRQGVLSEGELLEFRSAVETLASRLQLAARAPEMRDALEAARALDGICADSDIQVAFHVVAAAGSAFPGTKVRAAAEASGFVLDARGRFALLDEEGRELYELSDRSGAQFLPSTMKDATPQALTLSMDVPRAPETQRTFDAMVRFGKHLAHLLAGTLVDDNNQPLDERAVSAINAQLVVVQRGLESQGIAPGSALALRLFS